MAKYNESHYPDKANDFIDNNGQLIGQYDARAVQPITVAPTADNVSGNLQLVVLKEEPETRYKGYLYLIIK